MANARIQFSTADEGKWERINPQLREGELVISKNTSNKYSLYLGGPGGSKYTDAVLIWSQDSAEALKTAATEAVGTAIQKASEASSSAIDAAQSAASIESIKDSAAKSAAAAKASENNVAGTVAAAKASELAANQAADVARKAESSVANIARDIENSKAQVSQAATTACSKAMDAANSADIANSAKVAAQDAATAADTSKTEAKKSETNAALSAKQAAEFAASVDTSNFARLDKNNNLNGINTILVAQSKGQRISNFNTRVAGDVAFCNISAGVNRLIVAPSRIFQRATESLSTKCCVMVITGEGAPSLSWEQCFLLCNAPVKEAGKTLVVTILIANDGTYDKYYVVSSASGAEA